MLRYINGDFYEGNFEAGLPHGHGIKKEGHFMASVASVYMGEWANGLKQGYGVIDDIMTGKNYYQCLLFVLIMIKCSYRSEIFRIME